MVQQESVVCICETHEEVQRAIYNLHAAGVDMNTLSSATLDTALSQHDLDYYNVGEQAFAIPESGVLLVNGLLASWIAARFENGSGAATIGIVGAWLETLGVPHQSVLQYEAALKSCRYLLVLHGSIIAVSAGVQHIGGTVDCFQTIYGDAAIKTVRSNGLPVHIG